MFMAILSTDVSPDPENNHPTQPGAIVGRLFDTPEQAQQQANNMLAMAWVASIPLADANLLDADNRHCGGPYWLDTKLDVFQFVDHGGYTVTVRGFVSKLAPL
jgi:hypothetical protein